LGACAPRTIRSLPHSVEWGASVQRTIESRARVVPFHGGVDTDASTLAACPPEAGERTAHRRQSPGDLPPPGVAVTLVSPGLAISHEAPVDWMPEHSLAVPARNGHRLNGAVRELLARLERRAISATALRLSAKVAIGLPAKADNVEAEASIGPLREATGRPRAQRRPESQRYGVPLSRSEHEVVTPKSHNASIKSVLRRTRGFRQARLSVGSQPLAASREPRKVASVERALQTKRQPFRRRGCSSLFLDRGGV